METIRNILVFFVFLAMAAPQPLPQLVWATAAAQDFEDDFEDDIEDSVESDIEDAVESDIEDAVESDIEDAVESDIEDAVESDIEDAVESDIEDAVESDIEDAVEDDLEGDIEDDIENDVEGDLEEEIEASLEEDIDQDFEDDLTSEIEEDAEDYLDDDFEDEELEDELDDLYDDDDYEDDLEGDLDDDDYDEEDDEDYDEDGGDEDYADDDGDDDDFYRIDLDRIEDDAVIDERIILIDADAFDRLGERGYVTRGIRRLDGLGQILARIEVPEGFDLNAELASLQESDADARIDFNHVYSTEQSAGEPLSIEGFQPMDFWPQDIGIAADLHIGSIDSGLGNHATLAGAKIEKRRFVAKDARLPRRHGTAVASILVGRDKAYEGLITSARLSHAAAFQRSANGKTRATTASLILALDWMADQQVSFINMSLAGPPNTALARTIEILSERGSFIIAAVGNRGPAAPALYPAAHPDVIAVTAVNPRTNRPYRLAGRGNHVDFAAPGVAIVGAASESSGYRRYTGTSFAAPFVTALVALRCAEQSCRTADEIRRALRGDIIDLGATGRDPVFGFGLLRPAR